MSNIVKSDVAKTAHEIACKLTRTENSIVGASLATDLNPKICEMDGQHIARIITAITIKAATRLGSRPRDREEQQVLNMELNGDLMKFPNLTEKEIMKALENGLDGVYLKKPEDPVIFTPSNFVQWVRAYIEQTKKPVMKKVLQLAQQEASQEWQAPESEKLKMSFEYFKSILKRTLDGEGYEDYGNVLYIFLEKTGFMIVSNEDKWKAIDMAKLKLVAEAREVKDPIVQRTSIQRAMEMIQQAEFEKPDDAIISTAKRILITQKLQAFKEMPEEEQAELIEAVQSRVEYMCIELKDPEQYEQVPKE